MPELIDRNKLRKTICAACAERIQCTEDGNVCFEIACINNAPTIEPEARHGRWIYFGEETMHDGWTYRKHKCSECGFLTVEAINFCPNCGSMNREV